MTDIVKRLRDLDTATCEDAADEIERLRAQVRKSALDCLAADGQAADLMGEVSKLRAALREIGGLDDEPKCCGRGIGGYTSPPECCGDPERGIDRAQAIARAALEKEART